MNIPRYMTKVDDKLIRGKAINSPYRLYKMKKAGITQIIDLRNSNQIQGKWEKFFCKLFNIEYKNFKFPHRQTSLPQTAFFEKIIATIRSNSEKTYIHCQYGKRRTGICVAYYEKLFTQKTNNEILENMLNLGFKEILEKKTSKKTKKYLQIIQEFRNKYLTIPPAQHF